MKLTVGMGLVLVGLAACGAADDEGPGEAYPESDATTDAAPAPEPPWSRDAGIDAALDAATEQDAGRDAPPSPLGSSPAAPVQGPDVLEHVQGFANDVCAVLGACGLSTYVGHSPTAERALDILISQSYGELPDDDFAFGDRVAAYALANREGYRIDYVILRQRIHSGSQWQDMEDRGSITANHMDHVHVSFAP